MSQPGAQDHVNELPVCPRHPDVVAYTRCQRCGRPACVPCQVPASVGFQCVDCVAAERRENPGRARRSAVGMRASEGLPVVTWGIIALCVAVWLGELASQQFLSGIDFRVREAHDEPWRYVTSGFAHLQDSGLHLGSNMLGLYFMGQYLEPLLGRVRFALLYLVSVVGGSVGYQVLTAPPFGDGSSWNVSLVGASGGVFGLFAAVVVLNRQLGREIGPMLILIGLNVVLGFKVSHIAWQAHLGGALAGGVATVLLYALRRRPAAVQLGALAALTALIFVAAYVNLSMTGAAHAG